VTQTDERQDFLELPALAPGGRVLYTRFRGETSKRIAERRLARIAFLAEKPR